MHRHNEDLLQFIWQHRLLKPLPLITHSGTEITVLHPGELNSNAGPDFFNASIRLNNLVLNGNIEVHIKTSDWLKHRHQQNSSYNNLILHVVYEHDVNLAQNEKYHVEVLELKPLIDEATFNTYAQLSSEQSVIPCQSQLSAVNDLKFIAWLERMTIERLESKTERAEHLFKVFNGDYAQTFYSLLLRSFGFHVNSEPFELLSKHLPLTLLLKHADQLLQIEALLLGSAGFLNEPSSDVYLHDLKREYDHLKLKYNLSPLRKELFKFSRLRPANFPTLRLAQLAALLHQHPGLFLSPQRYSSYSELKKMLSARPQGYWANHYLPGGKAVERTLTMGKASVDILIINTLAPFFFFYSKKLLKPELTDAALALLNACAFEQNAKTRSFSAKKELLPDAACSQGLINLHDRYCIKKQCLKCGIGASLLSISHPGYSS